MAERERQTCRGGWGTCADTHRANFRCSPKRTWRITELLSARIGCGTGALARSAATYQTRWDESQVLLCANLLALTQIDTFAGGLIQWAITTYYKIRAQAAYTFIDPRTMTVVQTYLGSLNQPRTLAKCFARSSFAFCDLWTRFLRNEAIGRQGTG